MAGVVRGTLGLCTRARSLTAAKLLKGVRAVACPRLMPAIDPPDAVRSVKVEVAHAAPLGLDQSKSRLLTRRRLVLWKLAFMFMFMVTPKNEPIAPIPSTTP